MRKIFLIGIILLIIFSVSAISAAETTNSTQTQDDNLLSAPDDPGIDKNKYSGEGLEILYPGTLNDLQNEVNNAAEESTLNLYRDYTSKEGTTVTVSKSLTIDGHGHTIDCNKKCKAFDLKNEHTITIKNLRIVNGYEKNGNGGAICITGCKNVGFINCIFENNEASDCGGAVYNDGGLNGGAGCLNIKGCTFKNNIAKNKGGAVYCICNIEKGTYFTDSNFNENTAKTDDGGAIYLVNIADVSRKPERTLSEFINNCNFTKNKAIGGDGGAVFSKSSSFQLYVNGCNFNENSATGGSAKRYGGALCSNGRLMLTTSNFKNNIAENHGGAVYTQYLIVLNDTNFESNTAQKDYGGAIYVNSKDSVYGVICVHNCNFTKNKAIKGDGGAFYCDAHFQFVYFSNCKFIGNYANGGDGKREGGAIRTIDRLSLDNCYFKDNWAENHGGAIYANEIYDMENCVFINNHVTNGNGGALYINSYRLGLPSYFAGCTFNNNYANKGDGGAIYSDSSYAELEFVGCNFNGNIANNGIEKRYGGAITAKDTLTLDGCSFKDNWAENYGGAIYSNEIKSIKNCIFISNHAKEGGAIYVNSGCTLSIEKSYFKQNKATNGRGGAIYIDSKSSKLTLNNNAFVNDDASDQGKDVFNSGSYSSIKNNWWGENSPSFDNEKIMEYHTFKSNEKHKDENPNTVTVSVTRGSTTTVRITFAYELPSGLIDDIAQSYGVIAKKTVKGNTVEIIIIGGPKIGGPAINSPEITGPKIGGPGISIPEITITGPKINTPQITGPKIGAPGISIPEITITGPKIGAASTNTPQITGPKIGGPGLTIPQITITGPKTATTG